VCTQQHAHGIELWTSFGRYSQEAGCGQGRVQG
jgi:hypothetical protein